MISLFSFRGFDSEDPLDRLGKKATLLHIVVTAIIASIALYIIIHILNIASFKYGWLFWAEIAVISLVYAPIAVWLRKSSSTVLMLLMMAIAVPLDLYIQSNFRAVGKLALWMYNADSLIGSLHPLLIIGIVWIVDSFIFGPFCLWISRLVAKLINKQPAPGYNQQQYDSLFPNEWTHEEVIKPVKDFSYWVLRILGLIYVFYFILMVISLTGTNSYPEMLQRFLKMTYENPALTINTYIKVVIMATLCFIGAYNKELRFHSSFALLVGHLMSTFGGLFFYFYNDPSAMYLDYLITSAIVDFILVILFAIIMYKERLHSNRYAKNKEFPVFYSIANRLTHLFYYIFGTIIVLIPAGIIVIRLVIDGHVGWGAVYGFPDPQIANTLTKYTTIAFLAFLIARREKLREHLYKPLLFGYATSVIISLIWLLIGGMFSDVLINTRFGTTTTADWYFMLNVGMDGGVVILLLGIRRFYYNVEYNINAMSPSNAQNVLALHDALYNEDNDDESKIIQSIDHHIAGIRGRKRGLLNFPFWLVENVFTVIYGFHPSFSSMDHDHRRYFLRRYLLRPPHERRKSAVPILAELFYKLSTAVHALVTIAHYNQLSNKQKIEYIPVDARDRIQGDYTTGNAPYTNIKPLPNNPENPNNFKPVDPLKEPIISSRIVTPVEETFLPDEVDYIVIGSGAGGAVATYRLACEVSDPSRILMVERGPRFSPIQDFNDNEMEMVRKLYKEGGLQQTKRFDLMVLQGECLGGTTVVNNAVCFPMPDVIKNKWMEDYNLDLSSLNEEYDKIAQEIEIKPIPDNVINQRVKEKFSAGIKGYNATKQNVDTLENVTLLSNHRNPLGEGLDNIGNKRMRKRSMLETYIPWSEARAVKVVSSTSAVRFLKNGNRAQEVMLRSDSGTLKKVRVNKAVIVAAGVIASSHFLMRSGISKNVGKGLSCNFAFPVAFQFPNELRAFDGLQITMGAIDQKNRAVFETYFNPPGAFSISLPFYFNRSHDAMMNYQNMVNFGSLVGSEPNGTVELKANIIDGRALTWNLGNKDKEHIKYALSVLAEIGLAAGAEKAIIPTEPGIELPLTRKNVDIFSESLKNFPLDMSNLRLTTAHPQGGNRIIGDQSQKKNERVVNSNYRVDGLENVYIADASLFPTGITINPQWTIMAMSSMAAKKVLENESK